MYEPEFMQEAAEMVVWLKCDTVVAGTNPLLLIRNWPFGSANVIIYRHHFLVSQDNHEMFITVARFNDTYMHWLGIKRAIGLHKDGFLSMTRYSLTEATTRRAVKHSERQSRKRFFPNATTTPNDLTCITCDYQRLIISLYNH